MDDHSDTDADTVGLLDARVVSLRRLDDQDTDAVLALHEQLPDHDCYLRFFTMRPAHLQQLAHQLTAPNSRCCAIGAFDADKLIGVANYVVDHDDPRSAEVAIAVAHDDHQVGVGTALLKHLGEIAIAHGIARFTADVLATNYLMLQVLSDAGWPRKRVGDDALVLHFQIDLPQHRRRRTGSLPVTRWLTTTENDGVHG
ncbi:MAG: GNAT family N-acetyltransferase [Mycobacterium sp.]